MRFAIILAMFLTSSLANAATHECTTKIGINGFYDLVLDTETPEIQVTTVNGSIYKGIAGFSHSVRTNRDYYFLALGYSEGIEVRVDRGSRGEIWMCLDSQTCGLCR
jgi:hypothetical protein